MHYFAEIGHNWLQADRRCSICLIFVIYGGYRKNKDSVDPFDVHSHGISRK